MSFVLLGILNSQASGAAQAYFLNVLGGAGTEASKAVAAYSNSSLYSFGNTASTGAGSNDLLLAKYDSAGTIEWQRVLGGADNETGGSASVDSSENLYITGFTFSTGEGAVDVLLAKYDSAGTIQWQRVLGGADNDIPESVAVDSLGNVYISGRTNSTGAGGNDVPLAKYNSAGTIQWQRVLGGAGNDIILSVAIDSADNVLILGTTSSTGAGGNDVLLAKYDSAGTIQWQRVLGSADSESATSVTVDSSNNVLIVGTTPSTGAGGNDVLLAKYDSAGTIQWQRVLGSANSESGKSLAVDSLDNIYLAASASSAGAGLTDFLLAKYNSSGTIQWQRTLGGTAVDIPESISIDSANNIVVLGNTQSTGAGGADFLLAKFPNDGSLEGTYSLDANNIIYQASSFTAATSSLTSATSSLTDATSSLTSATSSLTDASASLTSVTLDITP